jgi:gas vesicle protein
MAKSKLRGGAKAHRSRVKKWQARRQDEFNRIKNKVQKEMKAEFEKMAEEQNDIVEVETDEVTNKEGV